MSKKKRELMDILLDTITPDNWPEDAKWAAQDKETLTWGKNKLMFYKQDDPPFAGTCATRFSGNTNGDNIIQLPELCRNWSKAIVTRDEFVKRWNERNNAVPNATTPPAQQESHTEEAKTIQQSIDSVISERGNNYGRFEDGAEIIQQLKHIAHTSTGWGRMANNQREAIDMILHKVGRILNGNPNYADSWIDIEGYSNLVSSWLKGNSK